MGIRKAGIFRYLDTQTVAAKLHTRVKTIFGEKTRSTTMAAVLKAHDIFYLKVMTQNSVWPIGNHKLYTRIYVFKNARKFVHAYTSLYWHRLVVMDIFLVKEIHANPRRI